MITPRLWKKLQAAQEKRGKGGKDQNLDGQHFENKSNGTKKPKYCQYLLEVEKEGQKERKNEIRTVNL